MEQLSFDVPIQLDDLLALQMRCMATPAMRAVRRRQELMIVLASPLMAVVGLAGGVLAAWLGGARRMSLGQSLHWLFVDSLRTVFAAVLAMLAISLGIVVLARYRVRPRIRRLLRRIQLARPDVDRANPQLRYLAHVIVNAEGVESRTAIGATRIAWGALKRWEEAGGRIIVLGDMMIGFCVPVSAIDPSMLDRFRAALVARLGPKH